ILCDHSGSLIARQGQRPESEGRLARLFRAGRAALWGDGLRIDEEVSRGLEPDRRPPCVTAIVTGKAQGSSPARLGGLAAAHRGQHVAGLGHVVALLVGHLAPVHADRQLAARAVDQIDLQARLLPQLRRQTGGVLPDAGSGGALADLHLHHDAPPKRSRRIAPPRGAAPLDPCRWRANHLGADWTTAWGGRSGSIRSPALTPWTCSCSRTVVGRHTRPLALPTTVAVLPLTTTAVASSMPRPQ